MFTKRKGLLPAAYMLVCILVCMLACLVVGCAAGSEEKNVDVPLDHAEDSGDVMAFSLSAATMPPSITYSSPVPALVGVGHSNEVSSDILAFSETPAPSPAVEPVSTGEPARTLEPFPSDTPSPTATPTPTPTSTPTPTPMPEEYTLTTVKNEKGYVKGRNVNLREGPGEQYDIIKKADDRTPVVITGKTAIPAGKAEQIWYRITMDGLTGFMLKDYMGLGSAPTPTPSPKPKATATPKPVEEPAADTMNSSNNGGSIENDGNSGNVANTGEDIQQGGAGNYSEADIYLAAKLIYAEGKSQSRESFLAMANILYNRCNSKKFGGSVEKEVYRSGQFTVVKYESFESLVPSSNALNAAQDVFNNGIRVLPDGVMFFRSASKGTSWSSRTFYKTIGGNNYYY